MPITVRLHRNVQFIYEEALAEQELLSFGGEHLKSKEDPWEFHIDGKADIAGIIERSAYFAEVDGRESVYKKLILPGYQKGRFNITRSVNQYLTHWIYPYKGKFHPQMIRALLNILGIKKKKVICDPFLGSGTAALEAQMMGIHCVGIDVSHLCILQAKVKTEAWQVAEEIRTKADVLLHKDVLGIDDLYEELPDDYRVRSFFRLLEMVVRSDVQVRKKNPERSLRRNLSRMTKSVADMAQAKRELSLDFGECLLIKGDARHLPIDDESIDGIVTSPPYSIALDYVKNDQHALEAMGYDTKQIREEFIGVRGTPKQRMALYREDMKTAFREFSRILKPGASAVVVIGDATIGEEVTTTKEMKVWGKEVGLSFEKEMPKIVYGLYSVITDEKILFFRKSS